MATSTGARLGIPVAATNSNGGADAGEGDRGALHVAQALRTLVLKDTCAHCGKQSSSVKRCSLCKQVSYCGAKCQKAAWKGHKKTCAAPLSTRDVLAKVLAASAVDDWREVLKWQGRMEEMMEGQPDAACSLILLRFELAHSLGRSAMGSQHHLLSGITHSQRRVALLGKMQRFRDQGEAMCRHADNLIAAGKHKEAAGWYQKARDVGAAHGFFSVECQACLGLGMQAVDEGRGEEGLNLLRNAWAAVPLTEHADAKVWELAVLFALINALFETDATHAIDEIEPLVPRYREVANAKSARDGRLCVGELRGLVFSARLHEAREKPQEAARDVRTLLDLMRENQAALHDRLLECQHLLREASSRLTVLHPVRGEEELIKSVAVELVKPSKAIS